MDRVREVEKLISSEQNVEEILKKLYTADKILYGHDVIEYLKSLKTPEKIISEAFEIYNKQFKELEKHARIFKDRILEKYPDISLSKFVDKLKKYMKRYDLTNAESNMVMKLIFDNNNTIYGRHIDYNYSELGKVLGYDPEYLMSGLKYNTEDKGLVNDIIEIDNKFQSLSKIIKLQSLTYTDCEPKAIYGQYDEIHHNINNYVHPIIAALFLPHIKVLDERILLSNLAHLVAVKNNHMMIEDYPTFNFYTDIVSDPNQNSKYYTSLKPLDDLKLRCQLQVQLWYGVNALRNGKYYDFDNARFMKIIGLYPSSLYDAPDQYISDDAGTILRRILNAFSFRPTTVTISSIIPQDFKDISTVLTGVFNLSQYYPYINHEPTSKTTKVSMITIRLPYIDNDNDNDNSEPITIDISSSASQWFVEKNIPELYKQKIINSNGVLFYYVNRNYTSVNEATFIDGRYQFNQLPISLIGTIKINTKPVHFKYDLSIDNKIFSLRSVVVTETVKVDNININSGTSAIILTTQNEYLYYNPANAGAFKDNTKITPITQINDIETFIKIAETKGTIFVYVNNDENLKIPSIVHV